VLVALYVAAVALITAETVQAFGDERPNRAYASLGLLMVFAWLGSRAWKGRGADPS
jgi:hypothetical protein